MRPSTACICRNIHCKDRGATHKNIDFQDCHARPSELTCLQTGCSVVPAVDPSATVLAGFYQTARTQACHHGSVDVCVGLPLLLLLLLLELLLRLPLPPPAIAATTAGIHANSSLACSLRPTNSLTSRLAAGSLDTVLFGVSGPSLAAEAQGSETSAMTVTQK